MKRPLAIFSAVFLSCLALHLLMGGLSGLLAAGTVFLFCALQKEPGRSMGALALCVALGLGAAYGAAEVAALRLDKQEERTGRTVAFTGWVREENFYNPAMLTLEARLEDGEQVVLELRAQGLEPEPGEWLTGMVRVQEVRPRGGTLRSGGITLYGVQEGEIAPMEPPVGEGLLPRLARLRQHLFTQVYGLAPGEASGVVAAMLFSRKDHLSQTLLNQVNRAGVRHLLVVSGLHLSILMGWVLGFCRRLRLNRWGQSSVGLVVVWLVAGLAGFSVSVLRAAVMSSIWLVGMALGRQGDSLTSLAFAAVCLALPCPTVLFQGDFLLSFSATLGLVLGVGPLEDWLNAGWVGRFGRVGRLAKGLLGGLAATLSAQLGALPVLVLLFGYLTTWSVLTNLLVLPFVTGVLVLGGLGAACLCLPGVGALAAMLLAGARWMAQGILFWVRGVCRLPWGIIPLWEHWQYLLCIMASGVFLLCCLGRPSSRWVKRIRRGSLCCLAAAVAYGGVAGWGAVRLSISNQGAVAAVFPEYTVVLDGGSGSYQEEMLSRQLLRGAARPVTALVRPPDSDLNQDLYAGAKWTPQTLWTGADKLPLLVGQLPEGTQAAALTAVPQPAGEALLSTPGVGMTCLEIRGKKVLKLWAGYGIIKESSLPRDTDLMIDREGRVYSLDPTLTVTRLWNGDTGVTIR